MPGYALIRFGLRTAGLASLCAVAPFGAAQAATNVGWVLADQPGVIGSYTPNSAHSYNSSGGSITVTNHVGGSYTVDFGGLYNGAHLNNVQVSAYQGSGFCAPSGFDTEGPGKAAEVTVQCYLSNGNAGAGEFVLEYQQRTKPFGSGAHGIAFLLADQPTNASYTPDSRYNYNSADGTNTIVRIGVGSYTVHIPFLSSTHSDVQVTAYDGGGVHCEVTGWTADGSSGTNIGVNCYNGAGNLVDVEYSLAYAVRAPFGLTGSATSRGAWAWGNDQSRADYTPAPTYQYNGFGTGHLTAQKTGHSYTITIPGSLSYSHSDALVTAVGDQNGNYCQVGGWTTQTVSVTCWNSSGESVNAMFDVVFQTYD